jgi:predicted secreted protein
MPENTKISAPAFDDARSKKVVFVAHCVLNQNSRIDTCATFPGAIRSVVDPLMERNIGIIQWPCPELGFLGMGRQGQDCRVMDGSYRHEDGEVFDQMTVPEGRTYLKALAENLVYQIEEYQRYGFHVLGILGIRYSPTCGVSRTYYQGTKKANGAFIQELIKALRNAGLDVPVHDIDDVKAEDNLALIEELTAGE